DVVQFSDTAERLLNLAPFQFELMRVFDVLVTTAAAAAEVRAGRRGALRRSFQNFVELCFGELFFLANNSRADALAIDREWNEDNLAVCAADAVSAEGYVVDLKFHRMHAVESNRILPLPLPLNLLSRLCLK